MTFRKSFQFYEYRDHIKRNQSIWHKSQVSYIYWFLFFFSFFYVAEEWDGCRCGWESIHFVIGWRNERTLTLLMALPMSLLFTLPWVSVETQRTQKNAKGRTQQQIYWLLIYIIWGPWRFITWSNLESREQFVIFSWVKTFYSNNAK